MQSQFAIVFVIVTIIASGEAQDVGVLLMDRRLVEREINCILERGPCGPIGRQIKGDYKLLR